ncbi:MAG: DUF1934 domain-containing protein [Firmicutes bacterium HGW-Firmicutes-1]|jgi:uncharacterized beta-barrel protein YwiB (DUF1934 family)|nr:MAG: DUF1934 domain-containing protein [Firmicutes bacterium HGW-Firmicutes-1]
MKKDVLITVKGIQGDVLDSEKIEMITTGSFYEKNDKYYIHYIDTALDSEVETKTSVKMNSNKVSITRFGATSTHMIFEEGVSHYAPYETPFGIFEIKTHTNKISLEKNETSLKLAVEYLLEINKRSSGVAYFELYAKEMNEETIL